MSDYQAWRSLREIDEASATPKGSAFRAFKAELVNLVEGEDFIVLDRATQATLAAALHAAGRLYRGSVNPVLLAPEASARISQRLMPIEPLA